MRVDGSRIRKEKSCRFKNIRIGVDKAQENTHHNGPLPMIIVFNLILVRGETARLFQERYVIAQFKWRRNIKGLVLIL